MSHFDTMPTVPHDWSNRLAQPQERRPLDTETEPTEDELLSGMTKAAEFRAKQMLGMTATIADELQRQAFAQSVADRVWGDFEDEVSAERRTVVCERLRRHILEMLESGVFGHAADKI